MSIKLKLTLVTLFLGCSLVQPVHAQWVKVGKTVSKQAVKALKSGKTTTVIRKSTQRTTTGSWLMRRKNWNGSSRLVTARTGICPFRSTPNGGWPGRSGMLPARWRATAGCWKECIPSSGTSS